MAKLLIDAPLLACPVPSHVVSQDEGEFTAYLARLADLALIRDSLPTVEFWRDESLAMRLHVAGAYPFHHSVSAMMLALPAQDFQTQDIVALAHGLLERSGVLDEAAGVDDLLLENEQIENDVVAYRPAEFADQLCRTLALAEIAFGAPFVNVFLLSRGCSVDGRDVRATFDFVLRQDKSGQLEEVARRREIDIAACGATQTFLERVRTVEWWQSADSMADIQDVCRVAWAKESEGIANIDSANVLRVGRDFLRSAQRLGFKHEASKARRLLKACTDLMLGRNLQQSHWIRASAAADAPQVKRAGWGAWRHDIDDEFHLHYWKSNDQIELANVVVHGSLHITA